MAEIMFLPLPAAGIARVPAPRRLLMMSMAVAGLASTPGAAQQTRLPPPEAAPLKIDPANDPILALGETVGSPEHFRRVIELAVDRHPALSEAEAQIAEGRALRAEARSGLFPSADVTVSSYKVLSRQFESDGLTNIVERSRPTEQTDATLSVNQLLFDKGATLRRVSAADARIRAAIAGVDDSASRVALGTISAWYDVFTFRMLVALGVSFRADQLRYRLSLMERIMQGVTAEADVARIDSAIAGVDTRLATYRRQLAGAEARFQELTGQPAPATLYRSPPLGVAPSTIEEARAASEQVPAVNAAIEQANAARFDARAARSDAFPVLGVSVDSGRYGVLETERDYDVRARLTLRARLGGAPQARIAAARARESGAAARVVTVREEAARDAAIAWSDVGALDQQIAALRASYLASRQSRDTIAERFRVVRGSLTDVVDVNDTYFAAATSYIDTLADRDAAHYVLLARTGRLLEALGLTPAKKAFAIR